ncbi:hypothetical protein JB92DRAFT_2832219 [Gautieria morchelliformis]|nr:hypothetical protein JB92DRAFT_2832219 [Gautieria morchelliformis]
MNDLYPGESVAVSSVELHARRWMSNMSRIRRRNISICSDLEKAPYFIPREELLVVADVTALRDERIFWKTVKGMLPAPGRSMRSGSATVPLRGSLVLGLLSGSGMDPRASMSDGVTWAVWTCVCKDRKGVRAALTGGRWIVVKMQTKRRGDCVNM